MAEASIEVLGRIGEAQIGEVIRAVTLAYAQRTAGVINENKPTRPQKGSMRFKSERQRRYVMAAISRGEIEVPYIRGNGAQGSETLNRSYIVDLFNDTAVLSSSASYARYVVGDEQAAIHQGRWTTAAQAVDIVKQSGDLDAIVAQAFEKLGV